MFMNYITTNGYGWGLAGVILSIFVLGAFVVGFAYLMIRIFRGAGGYEPENNALDILKRRHAPGELNKEEFNKNKVK